MTKLLKDLERKTIEEEKTGKYTEKDLHLVKANNINKVDKLNHIRTLDLDNKKIM